MFPFFLLVDSNIHYFQISVTVFRQEKSMDSWLSAEYGPKPLQLLHIISDSYNCTINLPFSPINWI